MQVPTNNAYTVQQKLEAVQTILNAQTYSAQEATLTLWNMFVPYPMYSMGGWNALEDRVSCTERLFETLRRATYEWFVDYRLHELTARVEALEVPNTILRSGRDDYR